MHILENREYTGCLVNFKTEKLSYKVKHSVENSPEKQVIFENHHEPIIDTQTWERVQELRKQRKRPNRYDEVGLFSGILFCADCGSVMYQQRYQTDKRKQDCYILKAVQNLAANFTDEVAAQLDGILRQMKAGENLKAQLQKQLEKAQQEFDRLLEMSLELDESTPFLDDKLRKLSGKIKILKANIAESTDGKGEDEEATKQLTAQDLLIKEYDDILTARIIEKVIVHSRQEIEIYFIGGYTQKIDLI